MSSFQLIITMISILYLQSESIGDSRMDYRRASDTRSRQSSGRDSISDIDSVYSDSAVSTTSQLMINTKSMDPINHELSYRVTEAVIIAYTSPQQHLMDLELPRLLDRIDPNQISCEAALTLKIATQNDIVNEMRFDPFTLFEAMRKVKLMFKTHPLLQIPGFEDFKDDLLQEWNNLNARYASDATGFIEYRNMCFMEPMKSMIVSADWRYAKANVANKRRPDVQSKNYEEFKERMKFIIARLVNERREYGPYLDDVTEILCMVVDVDKKTKDVIFALKDYENHQKELYDGMQKVRLLIQGSRFANSPRKRDLEIHWKHYDDAFRSKDGLPNLNIYRRLSNKADKRVFEQ